MPDTHDFSSRATQGDPLIEILRGLPQAEPQADGWARLSAQLRQSKRSSRSRRTQRWSLAVAAVLFAALLVSWLRPMSVLDPATTSVSVAATDGDDSSQLIAQSQWLERLVAAEALDPMAQDADQLLLEQGLRERIHQIDAALAESDSEQRTSLWRARVGTLSQLAEIRWAARQSAWNTSDVGSQPGLVSLVTWSN